MNPIKNNSFLLLHDPIEQFHTNILNIINYANFNVVVPTIYILLSLFILSIWTFIELLDSKINYITMINDALRTFVKKIIVDIMIVKNSTSYYNIFYIFISILILNLLGLFPYHWTATSWLDFVFYLALSYFVWMNQQAFISKGWNFFSEFLPGDSPIVLAPFLVPIEIISYIAKVISLAVRLFANMFSGHVLLKILATFSWNAFCMLSSGIVLTSYTELIIHFNYKSIIIALVSWISVSAIIFLETIVALLQAYVFTLLIIIFLNQSINKH